MSENLSYKTLKNNAFDGTLNRIDRVENPMVPGMFDINYCAEGTEGWIELKAPIEPKRITTKLFGSNHKISIEQINWCLRQRNAKGICWILISTNKRWMLIHGGYIKGINDLTVAELIEISFWTTTKPVKDKTLWKTLLATLAVR